ncbi:zinc finger, SWIM-type [Artemisia annua]|uniref:Zinc finger, SWIM-type n=1 Tax=Artemisia annua TaxID=35608 RepID=A0A2U1KDC1_ARTAN|nr:zinc finger, SWIM-type [Artemisia annua]
MASGATGDAMFHGLYGGCMSGDDLGVQRRPYHRNCSCALHNVSGGHCSHVAKVSYPFRRSYSEGSLLTMKSNASPSSSPWCASLSRLGEPITIKDSPPESVNSLPHVPNDEQ